MASSFQMQEVYRPASFIGIMFPDICNKPMLDAVALMDIPCVLAPDVPDFHYLSHAGIIYRGGEGVKRKENG
jgi:hypothetical protein